MTKKQKIELNLKRAALIILTLAILITGFIAINNKSKNKYYVTAEVEQINNKLYFYFYDNIFVWELSEDEEAPQKRRCLVLMDNNGTENFLEDDKIISFE